MCYKKIPILLFLLMFSGLNDQSVYSSASRIKGEILAYRLSYTVESDRIIPKFGTFIPIPSVLLVRVKEIHKSKERSEFVIIKFYGYQKDFIPSNFVSGKEWKFKLDRDVGCDDTISNVSVFNLIEEDGKTIKRIPNITWVDGVEKNLLPMNEKLPCYLIPQK